jgi:hypothetical protein
MLEREKTKQARRKASPNEITNPVGAPQRAGVRSNGPDRQSTLKMRSSA